MTLSGSCAAYFPPYWSYEFVVHIVEAKEQSTYKVIYCNMWKFMADIHPSIDPWVQGRRCPMSPHFLTRWVSRLLGLALVSSAFARDGVHRLSLCRCYLGVILSTFLYLPLDLPWQTCKFKIVITYFFSLFPPPQSRKPLANGLLSIFSWVIYKIMFQYLNIFV